MDPDHYFNLGNNLINPRDEVREMNDIFVNVNYNQHQPTSVLQIPPPAPCKIQFNNSLRYVVAKNISYDEILTASE